MATDRKKKKSGHSPSRPGETEQLQVETETQVIATVTGGLSIFMATKSSKRLPLDYLGLTRPLCFKILSEWSNRLEQGVLHNGIVPPCHHTTFGSPRLTTLGVSSTFQFNVWPYDLITLKRLTVLLVGFEARFADI